MEKIILALDNALKNQGISQTAIAKKLGIDQTIVNRLITGKTKKPDMRIVHALAVELGVSIDATAIATGCGRLSVTPVMSNRPSDALDIPPHTRTIPIISWAQAGTDGFFEDSYAVGSGIGRLNWFDDMRDEGAYALVIRGDSMIPRYDPGDYVIVSPSAGVKSGDYAIVKLRDGQVMAKQVTARNSHFILHSVNLDYEDITVAAEEVVFTHKIVGTRPGG